MILSMTGYGKQVVAYGGKKITVEVRSLNAKSLDLSLRTAPLYREKELALRRKVQEQLVRGKIDCLLWTEDDSASSDGSLVNAALVEQYYKQLTAIAAEKGLALTIDWHTLLRLPDVLTKTVAESLSDDEWAVVDKACDDALAALVAFRQQEGAALDRMFREKIANIQRLLASVAPHEKERIEKVRSRLVAALTQLQDVQYDAARLEQELIYYIEKLDIAEEKQRLANHLAYFLATLDEQTAGQGKKLGFIAQEMGREINTLGAKANSAALQTIVVMMKDELEQIKEQVLNVL